MKFVNPYVYGAFALSSVIVLSGCSSSPSGSSGPIVGNGATTSQPVTSAGGTVTLQGSSITIPPGAVSGNQTITITSTTSTPPSGVTNLSPIYQFGPSGLVFNKPVTIQLSYTPNGNQPAFAWTNLNSTTFGILPSTAAGTTVSGQVTHFSQGFVADGTTVASLATGSDDAGGAEDSGATAADATVPTSDSGTGPAGDDSGGGHDATPPTDDAGGSAGDGSACAVCANGFCQPTCPTGSTTCSGSSACVSIDSDPSNCGACGHTCADSQLCVGGSCVASCYGSASVSGCGAGPEEDGGLDCASCGAGYSQCGHECTQTGTDPNNCGACGTVCAQGQSCTGGACLSVCPGSDVCAGGACVTACPTGQITCGTVASGATGFCTSTQSDSSNCGTCGHACENGQSCVAGSCVASCFGSASVNGCGVGPQEDGGLDCASCGAGFVQCGSFCTQTTTDDNNCGTCGHACTQGQTCSAGACTPLCAGTDVCTTGGTCATACAAGQSICNSFGAGATSSCNDLTSDSANCGACGHACAAGEACLSGACVGSCGGGAGAADAGAQISNDSGLP